MVRNFSLIIIALTTMKVHNYALSSIMVFNMTPTMITTEVMAAGARMIMMLSLIVTVFAFTLVVIADIVYAKCHIQISSTVHQC